LSWLMVVLPPCGFLGLVICGAFSDDIHATTMVRAGLAMVIVSAWGLRRLKASGTGRQP